MKFRKEEYLNISFSEVTLKIKDESNEDKTLEKFPTTEEHDHEEKAEELEKWDQFTENEKAFNIKASFDEEKYTTKLDIASLTKQQLAEAEKISQETGTGPSCNTCDKESSGENSLEEDSTKEKQKNRQGKVQGSLWKKSNTTELPPSNVQTENPKSNQYPTLAIHKCQKARVDRGSLRTKYSLDCLGIDVGRSVDPDTYREMMIFKQQKRRMQAVNDIKSLVFLLFVMKK